MKTKKPPRVISSKTKSSKPSFYKKDSIKNKVINKELFILLLFVLATVVFFKLAGSYLLATLTGGLFALMFYPLHNWLEKMIKLPESFIAFFICIFLFLVIVGPLSILTWVALQDGLDLLGRVNWDDLLVKLKKNKIGQYLSNLYLDTDTFYSYLKSVLNSGASVGISVGGFLVKAIPQNIMAMGVGAFSFYFFLVDGDKVNTWMKKIIPFEKERSSLSKVFVDTARGTIAGSLLAALVQAIIVEISLLVTAVPNALFFGVFSFFLALIPFIGAGPIWLGALAYHLILENYTMAIIQLVFGIIVIFSDNIVRHYVLKERSFMHPVIFLVSILGGISWLGPTGIFWGPIAAALILEVLKVFSKNIHPRNK